MNKSKLIITKIYGNKLEKYYRNHLEKFNIESILKDGRLGLATSLIKRYHIQGNVLEMGSGYSWITAEFSRYPAIRECWCLDFSEKIMKDIAPKVFKKLQAKEEKITRILGSFYKVPCQDKFFDFIIFDAALHHVPNYTLLFKELRRILKDSGLVICTRERVLSEGRFESTRKFLSYTKDGALERIFTLPEWRFISEMNYFHFDIDPYFWYPKDHKKLKHYFKIILSKIPYFNRILAKKSGSLNFILRPKAFSPIHKNKTSKDKNSI